MTKEEKVEKEWHRKFAVDLFNYVWTFLDKEERSVEEEDEMVHATHASRFHWGKIGEPENLARGEWQVSRVYSVLGRPQPAIYHANRCLEICREHGIADWDLAFALESLARAHSVAGDKSECERFLQLAEETGKAIQDEETRELFFADLGTIAVPKN